MAYTNGRITIQVAVTATAASPASIQIEKDGLPLVSVMAPYTYSWDTSGETQGSYQIGASAIIGGSAISATPVTVIVDRTPPALNTRTPTPNSNNVFLADPLELVFSEPLNPASVPASAVTLTSSSGPAPTAAASLMPDGKTIQIRLSGSSVLTFPSTMTETVLATMTDLAGNALGAVAPWSWTAPAWVQMPDLPGTGSLALDTDGNPVVAFNKQSPTSSSGTLGVARYATGAIWDFSLGSPTSTGIYGSPPLSIDGTGAPAVVWSDVTAIYVARWNGSLWETLPGNSDPQQYMGLDVVSRRAVFLAYGPDGLPTIAFEGTSGANNGFAFVAKWSGSAWELLMSTDAPLGRAVYAMVLDAAGSPYILANVNSVLTVEHLDQSGWRSFDMSSLAFPELSYALALDSQERPGILTADLESGAEVIRGFYFSSNTWQSWTGNLVIGSNSIFSQLLVDSGGDPMVLWQQVDASNSTQLGHLSRYRIVGWDEPFGVVPAPATAAVMDSNDVPTVIAGSTVYRANHL